MRKAGAIIGSVCTFCALALILSEWFATRPVRAGGAREPQVIIENGPLPPDLQRTSFAPIVKKVAPSVVTISSTKSVRDNGRSSPLLEDPFLRRFFGFEDGDDQDPSRNESPRGESPRGGRRRDGGRQFQE